VVGKEVQFNVLYTVAAITREYGLITLPDGRSLVETLVSEGIVKLRDDAGKRDDQTENDTLVEKLRIFEDQARSAQKGVWNTSDDGQIDVKYEPPENPQAFLEEHKEHEIDGKLHIPPEVPARTNLPGVLQLSLSVLSLPTNFQFGLSLVPLTISNSSFSLLVSAHLPLHAWMQINSCNPVKSTATRQKILLRLVYFSARLRSVSSESVLKDSWWVLLFTPMAKLWSFSLLKDLADVWTLTATSLVRVWRG